MKVPLSLNPPIREFYQVTYRQTNIYGGDRLVIAELVHASILDPYIAWLIKEHQPTGDFPYRIESIWVQTPKYVLDDRTWAEGICAFEWGEKRFVFQRSDSTSNDIINA